MKTRLFNDIIKNEYNDLHTNRIATLELCNFSKKLLNIQYGM